MTDAVSFILNDKNDLTEIYTALRAGQRKIKTGQYDFYFQGIRYPKFFIIAMFIGSVWFQSLGDVSPYVCSYYF